MGFPDHLIPRLGTVSDSALAREAGVSRQAVAKLRTQRGIAGYRKGGTLPFPPAAERPAPPGVPPGDRIFSRDRVQFLSDLIERCLTGADPGLPGYAATLKLAKVTHDELLFEEKSRAPIADRTSPAELQAELRREAPLWPDQLLEIAVEVYCDRHGFEVVPRALRAV